MSVDRIEIFGCLIETRDLYSELPFDPRPWLSFYPWFLVISRFFWINYARLSFALLEFPLIIDDSFAEFIDSLGDLRQLVKAANGRNYFFKVS